jgi:hypothetical protein
MNDNEINRIAAMGNALRPDWPVSSLRTLLASDELRSKSRRDMAVALAWVACETDTKTPKRVVESGPWWRAANIETPDRIVRFPPKRDDECRRHPGEWADACRPCATEDRDADAGAPVPSGPADATHVRAQLALARGGLCRHGVQPIHCTDCTDTEESK